MACKIGKNEREWWNGLFCDNKAEEKRCKCTLGFTHNPETEEATKNAIRNNGRHSICQNNPWKWAKVD